MGVGRQIQIEVVADDALAFPADVLVLKHAQESLGVDAAAKQCLGLGLGMKLPPGQHEIFSGSSFLGAKQVAFLGVPRIGSFGYDEIRLFARRAMELLGTEVPDARRVALTLHGVGFGLDEVACFEMEVTGLLDAFEVDTAPVALEHVAIVESDLRRAERLRDRLREILPTGYATRGSEARRQISGNTLIETSATMTAEGAHAFVAMPFAKEFTDIFNYGIARAVNANGLLCERIDQEVFTGDVLTRMKDRISSASLLVADLSGANPNVYLEVGYAWACNVPTVLLYDASTKLMFDVQGQRCLRYETITELEERLTSELANLVG